MSFKEQIKYLALLKPANLALFLPWCKYHLKGHLQYGQNCAKLLSFKEQKKYFPPFKPASLAQFLKWCKHFLKAH